MRPRLLVLALLALPLLTSLPTHAQTPVARFDFQPATGPVAEGYRAVTPEDAYSGRLGYGFVRPPAEAVDSRRHVWQIFGRRVTVDQAIPASVLSDATRDAVGSSRPVSFTFRADVPPGDYDVTVWLGNVTRPLFQVRADVGGQVVDVDRMDVLVTRGQLGMTTLPDRRTPSIGMAVPRTVRVTADEGQVLVMVGPGPSTAAVDWTFHLDECPSSPPAERTEVLIPAFAGAWLQAITLHPAADPPLAAGDALGTIRRVSETPDPQLDEAIAHYNAGDLLAAYDAFKALADPEQRVTQANGLFWLAGHPAAWTLEWGPPYPVLVDSKRSRVHRFTGLLD